MPTGFRLLAASSGSVKLAIVMARRGAGAAEAGAILSGADGFLSVALGEWVARTVSRNGTNDSLKTGNSGYEKRLTNRPDG